MTPEHARQVSRIQKVTTLPEAQEFVNAGQTQYTITNSVHEGVRGLFLGQGNYV